MIGAFGGAGGIFLIFYSLLTPLKLTQLMLPFPNFKGFMGRLLYHLFFFVLYFVALPFGEIAYYVVFLDSELKKNYSAFRDLVIAAAYFFFNMNVLAHVAKGFFSQLFLAFVCFGIMMGMLYINNSKGFNYVVAVRCAVSVAVFVWLLFLWASHKWGWKRKSPSSYYIGNPKNIWRKMH